MSGSLADSDNTFQHMLKKKKEDPEQASVVPLAIGYLKFISWYKIKMKRFYNDSWR